MHPRAEVRRSEGSGCTTQQWDEGSLEEDKKGGEGKCFDGPWEEGRVQQRRASNGVIYE